MDFKNYPIILDGDTANEADDQFAVAYAALSETLNLEAVMTAPFSNRVEKDTSKSIDMSTNEAKKFLELAGSNVPVYEGARSFMPDTETPVDSPATDYLCKRFAELADGEKIIVCAIGCGTNIASALLKDPSIADKMILVWQVGHVPECPEGGEFNMCQDVNAARVIFGSSVEFYQIPAYGAASEMLITVGELRRNILGKNDLGNALFETLCNYICAKGDGSDDERQKIIWDIASIGILSGISCTMVKHPRRSRLDDESFIEGEGELTVCRGIDKEALVAHMIRLIGDVR